MSLWMYLKAIAAPRRAWALLAAVGLGLLVALTLLSMLPLYTSLVAEAHLQYTLASAPPDAVNLDVQAESFAIGPEIVSAARIRADSAVRDSVSGFTRGSITYLETWDQRLRISEVNGANPVRSGVLPEPFDEAVVSGYDMQQAGPHIHLFAGRLPQDTAPGQLPEVLVTNQMQGVHVGDTITLETERGSGGSVTARVVGIWYPADPRDRFWNGRHFDYSPPPVTDVPIPAVWPLVFSESGFLSALNFGVNTDDPHAVGPVGMIAHFVYILDSERVTPERVAAVLADVQTAREHVDALVAGAGVYHGTLATNLDQLLLSVQGQQGLLALPLAIVVAQLVGLALLFVVAMAGMLVDGQAVEIATLKSRGASAGQLLAGYGAQGIVLAALVAVPATLLATAASLALVTRLIPTPVGTSEYDLAPGYLNRYLASSTSPQALFLPALLGLLVGGAALILAAWRSTGLEVLALRREQGRSTAVPIWKRYYLDIGLAVLCAAGYLDLATFGTLGVREVLAGPGSGSAGSGGAASGPDPVLFVAPGLLLLTGALVVLRLFPYVAQLGAWAAARLRGATGQLAFAQVARGIAGGPGRLALLLTLAVGLGLFAITFQASLAQNARDRAAYLAGGDELVQVTPGNTSAALNTRFAQLPGVTASMPAYRDTATQFDIDLQDAQVLAVDPARCAQVTYWRADYAEQSLAALMAAMRTHEQGAQAGDASHPLWALVDPTLAANLHVHVGQTFTLTPQEASNGVTFIAGAIVDAFPTLFGVSSSGFLIVDIDDYFAAEQHAGGAPLAPSEYWLRTADERAATAAAADPNLQVESIVSRRALSANFEADPLHAGMIGLLLVGAAVAAMLALVGSIVQAALDARQRVRQFAILRTLGMSLPQLVRMLLAEQAIVYSCALVGGTLLGVVLSTMTLPFLQFGSSLSSSGQAGVPPYVLAFDPFGAALFYGMLLAAFVVAPLLAGQFATSLGLGKTLRLGED